MATLSRDQRRVAETFGRPISVMAGAGSGKTFTMVQRILSAYDPKIVGDPSMVLESIDQVLAITFTEKAAAELKSRIRAGLKVRGRLEDALRVDGAWIGTIHGMCARILRENALELGIDPAFAILAGDDASALEDEAIASLFEERGELARDVGQLLHEWESRRFRATMRALIAKAGQSPRGFDSISVPTGGRALLEDGGFLDDFDALAISGRNADAARATYVSLQEALAFSAPLAAPMMRLARVCDERYRDLKRARGALSQDDLLTETYRALERPEILGRYRDRFRLVINDEFQDTNELQFEIISRLSGEAQRHLCVVGDVKQSIYRFRGADLGVSERFCARLAEAAEPSVFSMGTNYRSHGDILDFTNFVFGSDERVGPEPRLPFAYDDLGHGRDEDALGDGAFDDGCCGPRIEVVEVEHGNHGARTATRLIAAEIARRFEAIHASSGRSYGDMVILLNTMTRAQSYADALRARDIPVAITGGSVFRDRPMPTLLTSLLRLLANPHDGEAAVVVLGSELFNFEPRDFRELVARALPDWDLSSRSLPVARALTRLLTDGGEMKPADAVRSGDRVDVAVANLRRALGKVGYVPPSTIVRELLVDCGWFAAMELGADRGPSDESETVAEHGGVAGMAATADALKWLRMAQDLEAGGCGGLRQLSEHLARRLEGAKEAPGFLATGANDFVRIMTIHASKGLEFPIVAVGGLTPRSSTATEGCVMLTEARGTTYALALPSRSRETDKRLSVLSWNSNSKGNEALERGVHAQALGADHGSWEALAHELVGDGDFEAQVARASDHHDLALRYLAMRDYERDAETAEFLRKAYVAFTRAREALIIGMETPVTAAMARSEAKRLRGALDLPALDKGDEPFAYLPDLHPINEKNPVVARIQRRRSAIARRWDYRLVSLAETNLWALDGSWPSALGGISAEGVRPGEVLPHPHEESVDAARSLRGIWEEQRRDAVPLPVSPMEHHPTNRSFSLQRASGIVSASSLKEGDPEPTLAVTLADVLEEGGGESGEEEWLPATEKGTAFHEAAQLAVLAWRPGRALEMPSAERLRAIGRHHGLPASHDRVLGRELTGWLGSRCAEEVSGYGHLRAELPFYVSLGGEAAIVLNGFIDLLAFDEDDRGRAHIVDYKTGTSHASEAERVAAYRTQAMVYAYAVLAQGYDFPKITFVFVDQLMDGEPVTCEFPPQGERWTLEGLRDELERLARS